MSDNNLASVLYLKQKLSKWRNIAIIVIIVALIALFGTPKQNIPFDKNQKYIAKVDIDGVILENDYRSKVLNKIAQDKNIQALIVNINSPGGSIVGSEILFNELKNISKQKPIVTVLNSLAASGGYMAAIASDHIIAHNGTITGSIGVIMQSSEITNLAEKLGINLLTYKSSPLKGAPSFFEKPSEQANQVLQQAIDDSHQFFVDLVKSRRSEKITQENEQIVFDGRIFTGRQALNVGLVDQIGGINEAKDFLKTQKKIAVDDLKIKKINLEEKHKNILSNFVGSYLPFLNQNQITSVNNGILAIMKQ